MSRPSETITALVELVDASPTDAEAWSELSDLYFRQGLHQQAIFSLEEVLLITPNAWNVSHKVFHPEVVTLIPNACKRRSMREWARLSTCHPWRLLQQMKCRLRKL